MFNIGENSSKYVKVWEVEDKGKYTQVKISTSRKDNQNEDQYINSNWFANLVGKAHNSASKLTKGTTIEITQGGIESVWSAKHEKTFQNVTIFDFNVMSGGAEESGGFVPVDSDEDTEELPF